MTEVKKVTAKVIAKAPVKEEVKKTEEVKAEAKEAPAKAEVKKVPAKKETTKKETAPKKEAIKKAPVKASAKTETKKAPAKKTAAKKVTVKESVNFQFGGKSYTPDDLVKISRDVWKYDLNGKEEDFKSVELYVKPEENMAYYVINGDVTGSFYI